MVLAAALVPEAAQADNWTRDADGHCQREWTARSLARGPIAVGNGVLLPFRSLAGGFTAGWVGAVLSPVGLMVGLGEGILWIVQGAADLATGGVAPFAPEGAADRLHFSPVVQFPMGRRSLDEYRVDGCDEL
jgi:hypothetical protein